MSLALLKCTHISSFAFSHSLEDFNKRMMVPDLSEEELRSLHSEAVALYQLYLKPTASHGVRVSHQLAEEINKSTFDHSQLSTHWQYVLNVSSMIMIGQQEGHCHLLMPYTELVQIVHVFSVLKAPACNVIQLRTTTPMFKAYEEVYNKLEAMSPSFYKSEQVNFERLLLYCTICKVT